MASLRDDLARALDPVVMARAAGIEPDPWQARLLRSEHPRVLLNCSRQSGKSTITALKVLHTALYRAPALILCLSPAERQSRELFRKVMDAYRALGRPVPPDTENKLELELRNGSRIAALPGNESTIRGYSGAALLVIDEASRVPDPLYMGVRPMLAVSGGSLLALSTPFGKRGWWHDAWHSRGATWERVEVPATSCPRITPAFLAEEREQLGEWFFMQEYMCKFMDAVDSVFGYEYVMAARSKEVEAW